MSERERLESELNEIARRMHWIWARCGPDRSDPHLVLASADYMAKLKELCNFDMAEVSGLFDDVERGIQNLKSPPDGL